MSDPSAVYARTPDAPGRAGEVVSISGTKATIDLSGYVGRYVSLIPVGAACLYGMLSAAGDDLDTTAGTSIEADHPDYLADGERCPEFVVKADLPVLHLLTPSGTGTAYVTVR